MLVLRVDLDVGYVDNGALQDCPGGPQGPGWARRVYAMHRLEGLGGVVVMGDMVEQLAVELKEGAEESVAQSHGASDDRVEDRLHVCRRLADHAKDLARRRLLLQGLGDISIPRLQLSAQPHVLCGDARLFDEPLAEIDLRV